MTEMVTISGDELERLKGRVRKMAMDKSHLQVINRLMNRMSAVTGIENTIENLLRNILDIMGGANLIMYHVIGETIFFSDVYGRKKKLDAIDDPLVSRVFDTREPVEIEHDFNDTRMMTKAFSKGYTWVFPLLVGPDLIGVFKMESLNIAARDLYKELPPFFNYAALILKNEIQGHTMLKKAYDELSEKNTALSNEITERKRIEKELWEAKERLEERVPERTAELRNANEKLRLELIERKRAEEALRLHGEIIVNMQEGVNLVRERDLTIVYTNPKFEEMLGYDRGELIGKHMSMLDARTERSPGETAEEIRLALKKSNLWRGEVHNIRKDGSTFWSYAHVSLYRHADYGRVFITVQADITERKQAESEIQQLKNYLANIIDSMPSVLVGMDRAGNVTQWNRRAEAATGMAAGEAIGKPVSEVLSDFSPWIQSLRSELGRRHPAVMEKLLLEKEGERRFHDLMLYPLITDGAEGAVIRIEDVTERTRIQELIVQTEKMMSVGGLAAGMAHEINNPLGIIAQAVRNIERRVSADLPANRRAAGELGVDLLRFRAYMEKQLIDKFIHSIRASVDRASRIVFNMLQFSRSGATTARPDSLTDIMDQAVELAANDYDLKKKYDFRSIEIVREYANMPETPMVAVEMEQVMLNLLKNAAQAMIGNPADRKPRIVIRIRRKGGYAVIEMEDNGPGMKEEIRRRVFEPFFTTKEPGTGTGLGLSVSYTIVPRNHKGLMEVKSAAGSGACFTIRLPLQPGRDPR